MSATPRHTNRLIHETSPYLLQHAHNPVDWFPWGDEALRKARDEDKPILLSIGYSACHWCHVMEHESFQDEEIAKVMSDRFVCIKVDREERPDLDDIYMTATVMMNQGQGGWPMTVFLTPDQKPFFAGTYFPPVDRYGRPGFRTVLEHFAEQWKTERDKLVDQAGELTEMLRQHTTVAPAFGLGEAELDRFAEQMAREFDETNGGFGAAPKFPPSVALLVLLRQHARTGEAHLLEMVTRTLHAMADGGIYDHVGGGFARYSTDEKWLVPHFEKMLYDNALLVRAYLEGYQVTGDPKLARVAHEVLDYALREMSSPSGAFYSATDADSEGEEGKFFVWTPGEIDAALGDEEGRRFRTYYNVTSQGNFEGRNIPNVQRSVEHVARELGITTGDLEKSLAEGRSKLHAVRQLRVPPLLDDKVLTSWNGLMISAMAEGHRVLGDDRYLAAGERAADFLLGTLTGPDGRLLRTWRAGKAHLDAYLEDYAYLAVALVELFEAGGAARWLDEARALCDRMLAEFGDAESGAFFATAHEHEELIVRSRSGTDGAVPAGNAMAAWALARLSAHFDRPEYREAAQASIQAYGRSVRGHPRAFATSLLVVDFLLSGPIELVLIGRRGAEDREVLEREIARHFVPNHVIVHHDPTERAAPGWPLLEGRATIDGRAALYVCRGGTCLAPLTEPASVADVLREPRATHGRQRSLARALPGAATAGGTKALAARFAARWPEGYVALGSTGLTVSKLGFGSYRVDDETAAHREALGHALDEGVNLIDTSTNYALGGSERLIGAVLAERAAKGQTKREEVVLVSKIGYVQGPNLELAQKREKEGQGFAGMVKYSEACWHCIHPQWLEDQLARSLDRLQVDALDVCLLHNPEYFLSDAAHRGTRDLEAVRKEFYGRMEDSFKFFETKVAAGKLRWYGVSSNSAGNPVSDPESTSVARMLEAARAAGGEGHHFRVLQLPVNLIESGPVLVRNTGPAEGKTALEVAAEASVAVLANRPLNAFRGEGMLRLADHDVPGEILPLDRQLAALSQLEAEFQRSLAPKLRNLPPQVRADQLARFFSLAEQLTGITDRVQGLEHWMQIEEQMILPQLMQVVHLLDRVMQGSAMQEWAAWRERYMQALRLSIAVVRREIIARMQHDSADVAATLDPVLPGERRGESLSRKALWVLASTPGLTVTLVGMRRRAYVDDALAVLAWPPLAEPRRVYEAFSS